MTKNIDKHIPLPGRKRINNLSSWPFDMMTIGDSFELSDSVELQRCRSALKQYYIQYPNTKFVVSKDHMRCWRTK